MANVSKVILGAAIAAVSLASPALAAHKAKRIHQNGYVTQSSQGSGVRAFASVPRSVDDPAGTGGGSTGYNQMLRLNQW